MSRRESTAKKATRKGFVPRVVAVAKTARSSAKAVLMTGRTLPPPVEIEPRPLDTPALRCLRQERERLVEELKHQVLVEQDHPATGNHMADDATEISEQAKSLALRRHLEGMLTEIDRAIVRAEHGMYGICERCGKVISEERLKVKPSATLCIDCAKLQVRNMKVTA